MTQDMSSVPANYDGREQAWIKHQLLESYLEKLLLIIGMAARKQGKVEICYVDCFAGPWGDDSAQVEGTSIAISLRTMAKGQLHRKVTYFYSGQHGQISRCFVNRR